MNTTGTLYKRLLLRQIMEKKNSFHLAKVSASDVFYHPISSVSMQTHKTGCDLAEGGVKSGGRNVSSLRYTDDTTLLVKI